MLQKIKYPVGSIFEFQGVTDKYLYEIVDVSKNEYIAFLRMKDEVSGVAILKQEDFERLGYKLVSTPRWTPEIGEEYFTMYSDGSWGRYIWKGDKVDLFRLKTDNVKRTSEECQKKIDEINLREI